MTKHVTSTTKKFIAAGGLAFSLAGLGLFAGVGTAAADGTSPDSGSYDELVESRDSGVDVNLAEDACWGSLAGMPAVFEVGDPESAGCDHSRVTSSYGPNANP